jgi:plasmid stabilization system protein ParE
MSHRVIVARRAELEMQDAALWWARYRSPEQASRWLAGIENELSSLANSPERCPLAAERERFPYEIRELRYGIGKRPTHRAIFTIADDLVLVLSVRHLAQDLLSPDDLS